jgi:PIN domain nuclease of toxin-antitoxin system
MAQVTEASFTFEIAIRASGIALPHRDPIDRLLAATASHYDLALVTSDSQVLKGKGFESLPADR